VPGAAAASGEAPAPARTDGPALKPAAAAATAARTAAPTAAPVAAPAAIDPITAEVPVITADNGVGAPTPA
jgi:hypothetical protein